MIGNNRAIVKASVTQTFTTEVAAPSDVKLESQIQVASFNGCENKQDIQIIGAAALAQTPASLGFKSYIWQATNLNSSCVPNLKSL